MVVIGNKSNYAHFLITSSSNMIGHLKKFEVFRHSEDMCVPILSVLDVCAPRNPNLPRFSPLQIDQKHIWYGGEYVYTGEDLIDEPEIFEKSGFVIDIDGCASRGDHIQDQEKENGVQENMKNGQFREQ